LQSAGEVELWESESKERSGVMLLNFCEGSARKAATGRKGSTWHGKKGSLAGECEVKHSAVLLLIQESFAMATSGN
jgi:hypothetical protein